MESGRGGGDGLGRGGSSYATVQHFAPLADSSFPVGTNKYLMFE